MGIYSVSSSGQIKRLLPCLEATSPSEDGHVPCRQNASSPVDEILEQKMSRALFLEHMQNRAQQGLNTQKGERLN